MFGHLKRRFYTPHVHLSYTHTARVWRCRTPGNVVGAENARQRRLLGPAPDGPGAATATITVDVEDVTDVTPAAAGGAAGALAAAAAPRQRVASSAAGAEVVIGAVVPDAGAAAAGGDGTDGAAAAGGQALSGDLGAEAEVVDEGEVYSGSPHGGLAAALVRAGGGEWSSGTQSGWSHVQRGIG